MGKKDKKDKKDKQETDQGKKRKREEEQESSSKKMKVEEEKHNTVFISEQDEHPPVSNFRVSPATLSVLEEAGIKTLFPIQAKSYDFVFEGRDIVGRARTGTGKTLSFCLPIIERLLASDTPKSYGRGPRMSILAPTRELAMQVHKVAEMLCRNQLSALCVYGGAPMDRQISALQKGIDVLIGTPGRVLDLIDRGDLKVGGIQYFVLDEADEMLNMGFLPDIEKVLSLVPKEKQTLLYSATIPQWVTDMCKNYLKSDYVIVDLVGQSTQKTAFNVKHHYIVASGPTRADALSGLIKVYSKGGKTMVFCDTKAQANDIGLSSSISSECQVLHGDIAQAQREVTMQSFRDGLFSTLVCTDVAARGLDVAGVDLVIHWTLPKDEESYVHRSGRTGRAGASGVSICFVNHYEIDNLKRLEKSLGTSITRVGVPQPSDMYQVMSEKALQSMNEVDVGQISHFLPFAEQALEGIDGELTKESVLPVIARALAVITGFTKQEETHSLLGSTKGYTTILVRNSRNPFYSKAGAFNIVTDLFNIPQSKIKDARMTEDGCCLLDIPSAEARLGRQGTGSVSWEIPTTLPEDLVEESRERRNSFGGGRGGRGGFSGGRNGGGGGGFGGGFGGGGRGGGRGGGFATPQRGGGFRGGRS